MQGEAVLGRDVERVALQRQVEQHRIVLEIVELGAGDLRARGEVDEIEVLGDVEVVPRRKALSLEVARRPPGVHQRVVVVGVSERHVGMGDVGKQRPSFVSGRHGFLGLDLQFLFSIAQHPARFDQRRPSGGLLVLGKLAHRLHAGRVLVHLSTHGLFLLQQRPVALVELDQAIDGGLGPVALGEIFEHLNPPVTQGGDQQIRLGAQELDVQHGGRR